ncbi:hypothetical protein EDC01DRAFT_642824 [Geopyxis carbonaria]|nr:hypothetical protein EDC01DRAFT_642824 [Geopyxis carbonaria]
MCGRLCCLVHIPSLGLCCFWKQRPLFDGLKSFIRSNILDSLSLSETVAILFFRYYRCHSVRTNMPHEHDPFVRPTTIQTTVERQSFC